MVALGLPRQVFTQKSRPCQSKYLIINGDDLNCKKIKHKNKIEIGIFTNAVREYVKRKDKNITKLLEYAEIMKIKRY